MSTATLKPIEWEDIEDAPNSERIIVQYAIAGIEPKQIARATKRSLDKVNQVLRHEPAQQYIEASLACANADELQRFQKYDGNVDKFLQLQTKLLDSALNVDEKGDWKPGCSEATMRKLLDNVPKHDPKGTFAPTTKHHEKREVNVVATAQIMDLREERLARHFSGEVLDVPYRRVDDDEFQEIRVHSPQELAETITEVENEEAAE